MRINNRLIFSLLGLLAISIVAGVIFIIVKNNQLDATQTTTSDAKTQQINNDYCKAEFNYPNNLSLEETDKNFFVVSDGSQLASNLYNISIDARTVAPYYKSYAAAQTDIQSGLQDAQKELKSNGFLFSGTTPPGFRGGENVSDFIFNCNGATIRVEYTNGPLPISTFNQIIESLKLN